MSSMAPRRIALRIPKGKRGSRVARVGYEYSYLDLDAWIPPYAGMTHVQHVTPANCASHPEGEAGAEARARERGREPPWLGAGLCGLLRFCRRRPRPSVTDEDRQARDKGGHKHHRLVEVQPIGEDDVDADELQQEAAQRIPDEIKQEEVTGKEPAAKAAPDPQQEERQRQIPKALIQKEGVELLEGFIARQAVLGTDEDPPGEVRRRTVQLLIDVVA